MVMDPTLPRISVRDLMMQAFLTGWELSDKTVSQDEYLQSSIQVIEMLQVEPENVYAEEGLGLPDGEEVDHLDDLLRADGQWLYYGVEEENFFLIQWYPDEASANAKVLWDDDNLYVYATVKDAALDKTGAQTHEQDSLEVFIDEDNGKTASYGEDDKQYRINYNNEQSFNGKKCLAENVKSATKTIDGGYVVEAAFK